MKIAAASYPLDYFEGWEDYEGKLTAWVREAAGTGAELLVFPEYGALELASLDGRAVAGGQEESLRAAARHLPAADALHARLAEELRLHILAASAPVWDGADRPVNRARLFGPKGLIGFQDKQIMTRFERETWNVVSGCPLKLFDTPLGRMGVLICYDSEFPLLARALVEAGAEIILVPSTTETEHGYHRVRVGSMARALEGQCVVVHSPTVGPAPWLYGLEDSNGAAGIYGPPDKGFPASGILAVGELNKPGWVYAEVSLDQIREVRRDGTVLNMSHWPEQAGRITVTKV